MLDTGASGLCSYKTRRKFAAVKITFDVNTTGCQILEIVSSTQSWFCRYKIASRFAAAKIKLSLKSACTSAAAGVHFVAAAGSGIVAATANDSGQGDACHPMPYLAFPTACIVSLDCVIGGAGRDGGWVGGAMGGVAGGSGRKAPGGMCKNFLFCLSLAKL